MKPGYLRSHRDGKHGHADSKCSHPKCVEAWNAYMRQYYLDNPAARARDLVRTKNNRTIRKVQP